MSELYSCLKLDGILRGLMNGDCILGISLVILPTCTMDPDTAVTLQLWSF